MKRWQSIHFWIDLVVTAVALFVIVAVGLSIMMPEGDIAETTAPVNSQESGDWRVWAFFVAIVLLAILGGFAYAERGFKKRYGRDRR